MKKIFVTGGGFSNKGAAAMLYITVLKCCEIYKNPYFFIQLSDDIYEIYNTDDLKKIEEKTDYNKRKSGPIQKLIKQCNVLRSVNLLIDISGLELTSKFQVYFSFRYLLRIILSKLFKVPVLLMPQSFGPFNYSGLKGKLIIKLIKKYMGYPNIVFARELEGFTYLKEICPNCNVKMSEDMVLQTNTNKIIMNVDSLSGIESDISGYNCIGFVPNTRLKEQSNPELCHKIYNQIVSSLRNFEKEVFLIYHSKDDLSECKLIKSYFENDEKVVILEKEFSCFEYEKLVQKFDFIIAARYHSIVHSYKQGIPCIAVGWAVKYKELLALFSQEQYLLDISDVHNMKINNVITLMEKCFLKEKRQIKALLPDIQKHNCFDILEELK